MLSTNLKVLKLTNGKITITGVTAEDVKFLEKYDRGYFKELPSKGKMVPVFVFDYAMDESRIRKFVKQNQPFNLDWRDKEAVNKFKDDSEMRGDIGDKFSWFLAQMRHEESGNGPASVTAHKIVERIEQGPTTMAALESWIAGQVR